jgi:isopentenyldiphosphate isomerase
VHAKGLLHRAVHIFVFNSRGELLLQKRSGTKDEYPLCWTSSASGHLSAGESYDEAAPRELEEELGLTAPLEFLIKIPAGPETANEHSALYRTVTDDVPVFHPEEIERGEYFRFQEIAESIFARPHEYTPPFRVLFAWYGGWQMAGYSRPTSDRPGGLR